MRIAVPTTSYPRFEGDVAGGFVRSLCRALVLRGHVCVVFVPASAEVRALGDAGIEVVQVPHAPMRSMSPFYGSGVIDNLARSPLGLLGALAFPASLKRVMARAHRASRFDAVLSQWALPSAWTTHATLDIAHVAIWHSGDVFLSSRLHLPRGWMQRWATRHVFVAEHLRARLGLVGEVIPMGIDAVAPTIRDDALRPLRVLSLGRLVPIKRVDRALAALAGLTNVELVVAGDGPERASLERLANALRVPARFVGVVDAAERTRLFAWADVLLATSETSSSGRTEGYPVAPREALAAGLVVVATDESAHRALGDVGGEGVLVVAPSALRETLSPWTQDRRSLASRSEAAVQAMRLDAWPEIAARFERELALAVAQKSMTRAPA